jgi:hypothetical protein
MQFIFSCSPTSVLEGEIRIGPDRQFPIVGSLYAVLYRCVLVLPEGKLDRVMP